MSEFFFIMPEIFLILTLVLIVFGEIIHDKIHPRLIISISLLGLSGAFVQTLILYEYKATQIFKKALCIDGFSLFFKLLFITLAGLTLSCISHCEEIFLKKRTEYCVLVLISTLALCLLASASDLILIFLSLLLLNIAIYFLSTFDQRSEISTPATVKYLIFSSLSSFFLLYSFAILFALTHSLNIYEIHKSFLQVPCSPLILFIAFMLSFLSLCMQIGAFPMYLILPDILEGSPNSVSALLSFGVRAGGFAVAIRFLIVVFTQPAVHSGQWQAISKTNWTQILAIVSALTLLFGALLAIREKTAKRLLSYLIISETGFLLIGLLVLDELGIAAILYNFVVDLFSLVGSFYILSFLMEKLRSDRLIDFKGMLKAATPQCICFIFFLLCLVGSPPLPGFIGKFTLISIAMEHQKPELGLIAIFSMVLSNIVVARLAYSLMGDKGESHLRLPPIPFSSSFFLVLLSLPLLTIGIFADTVFDWIGQSIRFIFW